MPRPKRKPLPPRGGIDALRFRLPDPPRASIAEELLRAFPERADEIRTRLAAGEVVDRHGRPVEHHAPPVKGVDVWLHLAPAAEPEVPGTLEVVHVDRDLVVADKPHFLATTPRAGHIRETALVRARIATGLDALVPAHRLDRGTAGLLAMAARPETRAALSTQFQGRAVDKRYLAVTELPAGSPTRMERTSRIEKVHGILQGAEIEGPPNAHTRGRLLGAAERADGRVGLWLLAPTTGQTHQLRIHLAAQGTPILGDDLYPRVRRVADDDFSAPLQLLAAGLELTHPATGERRRFTSRRTLARWDGPWPDAAEVWSRIRREGEDPGNTPSTTSGA